MEKLKKKIVSWTRYNINNNDQPAFKLKLFNNFQTFKPIYPKEYFERNYEIMI